MVYLPAMIPYNDAIFRCNLIWSVFDMLKRVVSLLVCLSFALPAWAAQEFILADIVIAGNQRVQTADILNVLTVKPGQTVTPADIDGAIEAVFKMQRFADISAEIIRGCGRIHPYPQTRRTSFGEECPLRGQ